MFLVIIKSDGEISKRVGRLLESLELTDGVYITWSPEEKVRQAVDHVKRLIIRQWEERGEGPVFEAAVLKLSEDQLRELRNMARGVVEATAAAMYDEMERLLKKLRSGKEGKSLMGWYRDLAHRYQKLMNAALALDVEPTALDRLKEKWKELSLEVGRVKK